MPGTGFSELQALGWPRYRDRYEEQVFKSSWFWSRIILRKKKKNGGESIAATLMYGTTPVHSISAYSTVSSTRSRLFDKATFNWKFKDAPITISHAEKRQNPDDLSKTQLLDGLYENAGMSMTERFDTEGFSDGTGNGSLDITGVAAAVADNPTTGTYGGINRATAGNEWWRNKFNTSPGSFATAGVKKMSNMYNSTSKGGIHPDLIVCDQETLEAYEDKLQGVLKLDSADQAEGDAGFRAFRYKGALMYFDELIPGTLSAGTGRMYFFTTRYIELWVDQETDMIHTSMERNPNQPLVEQGFILWMGQLVFVNCTRQGVIANFSA